MQEGCVSRSSRQGRSLTYYCKHSLETSDTAPSNSPAPMARWTRGKEGDGTGGRGAATWKFGWEPQHRAMAQHLELQVCSGVGAERGSAAKSCSETHQHLPARAEKQPCKSRLLQHSPAHWQSNSREAGTGCVLGEALPAARKCFLRHLCSSTCAWRPKEVLLGQISHSC